MQRIDPNLLAWLLLVLSIAGGCDSKPTNNSRHEILAEFPISSSSEHIFVPVKFKEKEYIFLFDTGCEITTFDISFRQDLGEKKGTIDIIDYTGKTVIGEIYDAPEAFVGSLAMKDCKVVHCADLKSFPSDPLRPYSGIIGVNFLKKYVVQLDFDNGKLLFLNPVEAPDPNWGTGLDLTYSKGTPHITGTILNDMKVSFLVDTGCPAYNALNSEAFEEIQNREPNIVFKGDQKLSDNITREIRVARLRNVAIGPFEYQNMVFIEEYFSILGLPFLSRHLVTLDFANNKIYLKKRVRSGHGDASLQITVGTLGFVLRRIDHKVTILSVDPNANAYEAGIRENDIILKVNGKDITSCDLITLAQLLLKPGAESVTITIRRDGDLKKVTCSLED